MRVAIVSTSDARGGAAVAAHRLADALCREGVEATMVVARADSGATASPGGNGAAVVVAGTPWQRRWAFLWERLRIFVANGLRRRGLWDVDIANAGVDITQTEAFRRADIVHLHWVNQGFLSLGGLRRIVGSGKPVVWTMHDMWPCTAICHHAGECGAYERRCHTCPQLLRPGADDLAARVFGRKQDIYSMAKLHFVAVSEWMACRARRSALTAGHDICVIPNALPMELFHPTDRLAARRRFGIAATDRVVAFGAARIDQPLKGFGTLVDALRIMAQRLGNDARLHLLLFGSVKDRRVLDNLPCSVTWVGMVGDVATLCDVYSAADVLASASDYETFGQTIVEAMACGCVAVSFDRGGQTDIISHRRDGYLARQGDTNDLANGLWWALQSPPAPQVLRQSVASRFSGEAVAQSHIELYKRLLA